ncbi:hypothetical protein ANN_04536, partial [Periplaneta americana]
MQVVTVAHKHVLTRSFPPYQNGFRQDQTTSDNIRRPIIRLIKEKVWEYNHEVQYLFIDFAKAYDLIHRESLWNIMAEFGRPLKLIRFCEIHMEDT